MRLPALLAIVLVSAPLAAAAPARAAGCSVETSTLSGPAPLHVTFNANGCSAGSFHWDFGDSQAADGTTVEHDFAAGAFTVTLTSGGSAVWTAVVESQALQLEQPGTSAYGAAATIGGQLVPARAGVSVELVLGSKVVAQTQTGGDGSFAFRLKLANPGPYFARSGAVVSASVLAPIRPRLKVSTEGARIVGQTYLLNTRLRPAASGKLRLVVFRDHRRVLRRFFKAGKPLPLPTSQSAGYTARVELVPGPGYVPVERRLHFTVGAPRLQVGSRGQAVHVLERTLIAHRFALLRADSVFGADTLESVYALQKLAGLPRTGSVNASVWLALGRVQPPRPRLRGNYVEVDKTRQVLYIVRNRKVLLIVPVSTGASGNTPIGLFHVYSKVPGGAVMYYSNYFTGAFAIHGYVSVPPYPASHGCVRVPMWVAIRLYGLIPLNTRVLIRY